MLAQTTPLSRWQALSAELMAVLDGVAATTDFDPTLFRARMLRARLARDIAWSNSTTHEITRDAILSTLLDKWGPNRLTPAVYDCEASARRHATSPALEMANG